MDTQRVIRIVIDASKAKEGGAAAQAALNGIQSAAMKLTGLLGAAFSFGKVVQETIRAEKALAQLDAAVKSTGGAAGLTTSELAKMAAGFQKVTAYGDESVMEMQAVLLTFTRVGREVFPQASAAILDMATRLNMDLKSATIQVGKALNDPIKGITSLTRAGVQFSSAQKDMIKTLVDSGRGIEAQKIILKELETQFGGSAAAARNTLGGALEALSNKFGDLLEVTGGPLDKVTSGINTLTDNLDTLAKAAVIAGGALAGMALAAFASNLVAATGGVLGLTAAMRALAAVAAANPLGLVLTTLGALAGAAAVFWDETVKIGDTTVHVGALLKTTWDVVWGVLKNTTMQAVNLALAFGALLTLDFGNAKAFWEDMKKNGVDAVESVTGALEKYKKNLADLNIKSGSDATGGGGGGLPPPFNMSADALKKAEEATSQLDEFMEGLRDEVFLMQQSADAREEWTAILRAGSLAMADYQKGLRDSPLLYDAETAAIRANIREKNALKRAEDDAAAAFDALSKAVQDGMNEWQRVADRTTDRIVDGFADMLEGGKDAFRNLKDFALGMFREITANAVIRPVIQPIIERAMQSTAGQALGYGFAGYELANSLTSPRRGPGNEIGSAVGGTAGAAIGLAIGGPMGAKIGAFIGSFAGGTIGGMFGARPSDNTQFSDIDLGSGRMTTGGFTGKRFDQGNLDAAKRLGDVTNGLIGILTEAAGGMAVAGRAFFEVGSVNGVLADINGARGRFAHTEAGGGQAVGFVVQQIAAQLGDALPESIRTAIQNADWSNMDAAAQALIDAIARVEFGKQFVDEINRQLEEAENPFTRGINQILGGFDAALPNAREFGVVSQLERLRDIDLEKLFKGMDAETLNNVITYYSTVKNNQVVVDLATVALGNLTTVVSELPPAIVDVCEVVETFLGMTDAESDFVNRNLAGIDEFINTLTNGIADLTRQADQWRGLVNSTGSAWRSLLTDSTLSPLSPQGRLQAAESQYNDLRSRAALGEISAIEQLPAASRDYLSAARDYFGGGEEYYRRFADVQGTLQNAESVASRHLGIAESQLEVLQTQLTEAEAVRQRLTDLIDGQAVVITSLGQLNDIAAAISAIVAAASQPRVVGAEEPKAVDTSGVFKEGMAAINGQLIVLNETNVKQANELAEVRAQLARSNAA